MSRCAWLDYDGAAGLVRAGGNARDEINGGNYSVAVNDTMVQVLPSAVRGPRSAERRSGTLTAGTRVWDASTSNTAGVWCGFQYRALTYHRWTGASNGSEWITSNPIIFC